MSSIIHMLYVGRMYIDSTLYSRGTWTGKIRRDTPGKEWPLQPTSYRESSTVTVLSGDIYIVLIIKEKLSCCPGEYIVGDVTWGVEDIPSTSFDSNPCYLTNKPSRRGETLGATVGILPNLGWGLRIACSIRAKLLLP